jgi:hypothetical protein
VNSNVFTCVPAESAVQQTFKRYDAVVSVFGTKKPIILAAYGWPSSAGPDLSSYPNVKTGQQCAIANQRNQMSVNQGTINECARRGVASSLYLSYSLPFEADQPPTNTSSIWRYWGICSGTPPYQCLNAPGGAVVAAGVLSTHTLSTGAVAAIATVIPVVVCIALYILLFVVIGCVVYHRRRRGKEIIQPPLKSDNNNLKQLTAVVVASEIKPSPGAIKSDTGSQYIVPTVIVRSEREMSNTAPSNFVASKLVAIEPAVPVSNNTYVQPEKVQLPSIQEDIMSYLSRLDDAMKYGRFKAVAQISDKLKQIAHQYGTLIPNPSNTFMSMICAFEQDSFRNCQPEHMQKILNATHAYAVLTMADMNSTGAALSEKDQDKIMQDLKLLKKQKEVGKNKHAAFHLDCIRNCVKQMQDSSLSAKRILASLSNLRTPDLSLPQVVEEIGQLPKTWYEEVLATELLVFGSDISRPDLPKAISDLISGFNKSNWHVPYQCVTILSDIITSSPSENAGMILLTGQANTEIDIHDIIAAQKKKDCESNLIALSTFAKSEKKSKDILVRVHCVRQLFDIAQNHRHTSVRKAAMLAVLNIAINETDEKVSMELENVFKELDEINDAEQWQDYIHESAPALVEQLDKEWKDLRSMRYRTNDIRINIEVLDRKYNTDLVEYKVLQESLQLREKYMDEVLALFSLIKNIKKLEVVEPDEGTRLELERTRMEAEAKREVSSRKVKEISIDQDYVLELQRNIDIEKEQLNIEQRNLKAFEEDIDQAQAKFNLKRQHFENVKSEYQLMGTLAASH